MRSRAAYLTVVCALLLPCLALPLHAQGVCTSFPMTVPLVSGTTTVGSVTVMNDATNLYVVVQATAPYTVSQLAVQVGTALTNIPQTAGNPVAAQFANRVTFEPATSSFNYGLALGGNRPGTPLVIAVNATVLNTTTSSCGGDGGDDDHHDGDDHHGDDHHQGDNHDSSLNGHSSYSSSNNHHGDDHSGDDHHDGDHHDGDGHHGDDGGGSCTCGGSGGTTQLSAWAGTQLFPGNSGATYIAYTVNCSNIE